MSLESSPLRCIGGSLHTFLSLRPRRRSRGRCRCQPGLHGFPSPLAGSRVEESSRDHGGSRGTPGSQRSLGRGIAWLPAPGLRNVEANVRVELRAHSIWRALEAVWLVDDQTNTPVAGWNLERLAQGNVDRLNDVRPGSLTEWTAHLDQDARHHSQSSSLRPWRHSKPGFGLETPKEPCPSAKPDHVRWTYSGTGTPRYASVRECMGQARRYAGR